jgi:MFS family permease
VLRHREFALLFTGQAVSSLGDRIVLVAGPFAVLAIPGAGPTDVGLVLGANAVSFALFVLVGGVVSDRVPRRLTMLASDVGRALVQAVTAALLLTHHATVPRMVVLQLLYGAAEAFFRPAALGMVPQVVAPGEEQAANALLSLSLNASMVVGPAVAGLLVAVLGPGGALAVDAGTFVISALSLLTLRPRAVAPSTGSSFRAELVGGWRHVRSRTWVWTVLLSFSAYHALVLPALFVLGPKVAQDLRGGSSAWGWISSGFGVGAVVGSLLALRWRPARPGLVIGGTLAVASAQAVVVTSSLPTAAVAAIEAVTGVGVSLCFTVWETALQQRIPADAQSRVSSFDHLVSVALMPVGFAVIGPLAAALGTRTASLGATLVAGTVAVAVALTPSVRRLRAVPAFRSPSGAAT